MIVRHSREDIWKVLTFQDPPGVPWKERRSMHIIGRALAALNNNEYRVNWRNTTDRGMCSKMSRQYLEVNYLTLRQVKCWLTPDIQGIPRICQYWEILAMAADKKQQDILRIRSEYNLDQGDLFKTDRTLLREALEKDKASREQDTNRFRRR